MNRLNEAVALAVRGAYRNGKQIRLPCPVHGGTDALVVSQGSKRAVWHCHAGCDAGEVGAALERAGIITRAIARTERSMEDDKARKLAWCNRVWAQASPLPGISALDYMSGRGLHFTGDPMLRFGDGLMIAAVHHHDGPLTGIHLTRFGRDRRAHGTIKGGAIRLGCLHTPAAIAEGIETALAWSQLNGGKPCWSLISAGGIAGFTLPKRLDSIIVAADFDGAGITAYERLRKRYGERVILDLPPRHGMDWNDVLQER